MPPDPASAHHDILCLNSGSSSLKFALYQLEGERATARPGCGGAHRAGQWTPLDPGHGQRSAGRCPPRLPRSIGGGRRYILGGQGLGLSAPGRRGPSGGPRRPGPHSPGASGAPLLAELRRLVAFAPLHLPSAIQGIEAVAARFPGLPQVACLTPPFTAVCRRWRSASPVPRPVAGGIRRYGFHGLSYEYIMATLGAAARVAW